MCSQASQQLSEHFCVFDDFACHCLVIQLVSRPEMFVSDVIIVKICQLKSVIMTHKSCHITEDLELVCSLFQSIFYITADTSSVPKKCIF